MNKPDPLADLLARAQKDQKRIFLSGLDLGQAQDPSALAIVEKIVEKTEDEKKVRHYAVRHLIRWPLKTSYTDIVDEMVQLFQKPVLSGSILCIDGTGVGRAVVDMFRKAKPRAKIVAISITGGEQSRLADGEWHVAKKDLVSIMLALVGTRRIQVAKTLPLAKVLTKELGTFKRKINIATGNELFEAWRERDHDDLVLATAMPCWYGERAQMKFKLFW
ncbi:MAG TPA: hypothetical protein VGX70_20415 [Gemmataceae bacterium]|nr:hypothetical protein [Gemmataceae bacterium]